MGGVLNRLAGFIDGRYVDRPACDAAFERMHRRDAIGDRIHLILGCLALIGICGPTSVGEIAVIPMLVFFVVRVVNTGPVWIHGFGQPAFLAVLGLFGWLALTTAWSPDPGQGWMELARMRWFLFLPLLFPVIERRGVLAGVLAAGLIGATVAQIASGFEPFRGWFAFRHPGRVSGWWQPVVAGTIQVGALGFFLPAAMAGRGWARWVGLVGLTLAGAGLIASGTRGAWLAAVGLLAVAGVLLWRGGSERTRRSMLVAGGVLAVGVVVAGFALRDGVMLRVDQARDEIRLAMDGRVDTPTGGRIAAMRAGVDAGLERPLRGAGAGSFEAVMAERYPEGGDYLRLAHAHSTPVHLFATGGVPAVVLGGLLMVVLIRNAWRSTRDAGALERGVPFALIGLAMASVFDVVLINSQVAALVGALAALGPAYRPGMTDPTSEDRAG